jgi:sulfite reductase (NADPH) flavoprotein alpha-component
MSVIPSIPENAPFNAEQRAWLNGFLAGIFYDRQQGGVPPSGAGDNQERLSLLIMFGSQTGTAEGLAKKICAEANKQNFKARVLDMNAFASADWKAESRLLIVTSTWGDGEPPDNAVGFWNFLNADNPPALEHLHFSVLALGDRNYTSFCGAGRKFDERLEKLGAKRVHARTDCDVDYEAPASAWISEALKKILECGGSSAQASGNSETSRELKSEVRVTSPPPHSNGILSYNRQNPFPARLLTNKKLNGPGSAKDTRHFEICLNGSGLNYEVGDALGVLPRNSSSLVDELLVALHCDGEEAVKNGGADDLPLRKALLEHFEIRQIGGSLLKAFAERSGDANLTSLLDPANKTSLDKYLYGREIVDLFCEFPTATFSPAEFVTFLRKLNPRLYSISSSPKAHPGEVHLTVAAVRYESNGRRREGVCSTFLADRVDRETPVGVFVQTSHGFRLPADSDTPIIMIGPGTGIAPFRAFLEERRAVGAKGTNWLFFGDQRRDLDFLYREELETMTSNGFLTRFDTAFSRDQAEKIYVQDRMIQQAREVWSWLEQGAHIYVCGDAKRMAKDVDAALHEIIKTAGNRSVEAAAEYVQQMKTAKRYQRDVY